MRSAALPSVLLLLLVAPASAGAGEPQARWSIPRHGAAIYDREYTCDWSLRRGLRGIHEPLNAAVVFQGELAASRTHLAGPVHDVRDLALHIAADLRHPAGGDVVFHLDRLHGFAAVRAVVRYGAPSDDGRQPAMVLLQHVAGAEPSGRRREASVRGRMRLTRTIDHEAGRVAWFRCESDLVIEGPQMEEAGTLRLDEAWRFREVLRPTDAAFRTRVVKAIERSAVHLRDAVARSDLTGAGAMGRIAPGRTLDNWQGSGGLALTLLAVLKSGHHREDPVILAAIEELRTREIRTTYSLALAIMALEALYAPLDERDRLISGRLKTPATRPLTDDDRAIAKRWTDALIAACDSRVDSGYLLRWRYRHGPAYDNSNTQYALLGLYSARLAGVRVPPHIWNACAKHWVENAAPVDERPFRLVTRTNRELKEERTRARDLERGGYGSTTRTRDRGPRVAPVAWGYRDERDISGSMTAAGVSSLTIAGAGPSRRRGLSRELRGPAKKAVRGGMAWLARHFSVRGNPGRPHSLCSRYYYLYGIERALELNGVALLHDRDWYFEGAVWLIETQDDDGGWYGGWDDTAFGLLFLKKAVPPVVTPR